MTIETLLKVIPPPATPFEAFSGPWDLIEAGLRTTLPQDYKDFVRLYGSGYFMRFLGVSVPRSKNPNVRLVSQVQVKSKIFREMDLDERPYPYWSQPGGLIPFGTTDNGDELFWLARGAPAEWVVVVWDRGDGGFETFDCDLTDFLAGLATGEIIPEAFPEDLWPLLPGESLFEPNSALT